MINFRKVMVLGLVGLLLVTLGVSVSANWQDGGGGSLIFSSPTTGAPRSGTAAPGNTWVQYTQNLPGPKSIWYYAGASNIVITYAAPPPITSVTAYDNPGDQGGAIVVTWSAASEPPTGSYYNIYVTKNVISNVTGYAVVATRSYSAERTVTVYGLNKSTTYYAYVTGVDVNGGESKAISAYGGPVIPGDNLPPGIVAVTATDIRGDTGGQIQVGWELSSDDGAGSNDISGYKIFVGTSNVPAQLCVTANQRNGNFVAGQNDIQVIGSLITNTQYYVAVLAYDKSGNANKVSANIIAVTPLDDLAPDAIRDLISVGGNGSITLNWTNNSQVEKVTLVRKANGLPGSLTDGTKIIDAVSSTPSASVTYLDTGLVNGVHYYYKLWVIDNNGNYSDPSSTHAFAEGEIILGQVNTSGPAGGLVVSTSVSYVTNLASRRAEYLGVPPAGVTNADLGFNLVANNGTPYTQVRFDIYMGEGVQASGNMYKISPSGNWTGPIAYTATGPTVSITLNVEADGTIDPLFVFTPDNSPPDPITNLQLAAVKKEVRLTWALPNTSLAKNLDFAGFTLRRSTTGVPGATDGVEVASGNSLTSYTDDNTTLADKTTYYYAIYTFDKNDPRNYSAGLNTSVITDFSPPAAPTLLTAENIKGNNGYAIRLQWPKSADDYFGGDVYRYVLYRSTTTNVVTQMVQILSKMPDFKDVTYVDEKGIVKGTTYYYALIARDMNGNDTIDLALIASVNAVDSAAPPPVTNFLATVTAADVVLTWANPTDMSDVSYNKVIRKAASLPTGPSDPEATVLIGSGLTENYSDLGVPTDAQYYYSVYTFDDSGNYSEVKAKIVDRAASSFGAGTYSAGSKYTAFGTKSKYAINMTVSSKVGATAPVTFLTAGTWTCALDLLEGENMLTITSYTVDGTMLNQYETMVIVDTIPPAPPQVLVDGKALLESGIVYTNNKKAVVKGMAEPGVKINMQTNSTQFGTQAVVDTKGTSVDNLGNYNMTLSLVEGMNYVNIMASDYAGNMTMVSGRIVLDTVAPSVNQITFDGGKVADNDLISTTPLIKVKLVDIAAGIDSSAVTLSIDGVTKYNTTISQVSSNVIMELSYQATAADFASNLSSHTVKIEVKDRAGNASSTNITGLSLGGGAVAVQGSVLNVPNPFNPASQTTKITYQLTAGADIDIYIYNITGERILHKVIASGAEGGRTGYNEVVWNGQNSFGETVGNGVYLAHVVADGKVLGKVKILAVR